MRDRDYSDYPRPRRRTYIRVCAPPLTALLLISTALASYLFLSHVPRAHDVGWQAYEVVQATVPVAAEDEVAVDAETGESVGNGGGRVDAQVESLPLDVWDPLARHTTGLTEVRVQSCIVSAHRFPSFCAPKSTPEADTARGKWVLVDRNLNRRTGLWNNYIYYRRTRRLDVPLITDLKVLPEPPGAVDVSGWTRADGNLHAGVYPRRKEMRLWYRTAQQGERDGKGVITEMDVLYGDNHPFFGFMRVPGGPLMPTVEGRWESVDIVLRRGNPVAPAAPMLRFHEDGSFKVMQIADLHYSVGTGTCQNTPLRPCNDSSTAAWLSSALDGEKPDLVVFSGDQLNGQGTSYDTRSVLAKFAQPVIDRHIPWAAVFGNHDSEINDDRKNQMRALQAMPYSLARTGPEGVDGVGNYDVRVYSGDPSRQHVFTLYFLDSHAYPPHSLPFLHLDYDYIKPSQINWYLNVSSSIKPILRPFRPDTGVDLGHIWRANGSPGPRRLDTPSRQSEEPQTLAKPNAMMFFHIPLPEAYDPADKTDDTSFKGGELDLGSQYDAKGTSSTNGHLFSKGIQHAFEVGPDDTDGAPGTGAGTHTTEVKVLGHGHCHNTDRCRRVSGVWMCFDGGTSYSGYGLDGFDRRVRVYNVSQWGETIATYKRLVDGRTIDQQVLVGEGAPAGWGRKGA